MHGKFKSFLKDNSADYDDDCEFLDIRYIPYLVELDKLTREKMYAILHNKFGFRDFRHCQKQVIIASLLNRNCCVLMPTDRFNYNTTFTVYFYVLENLSVIS
jgi:hypothetical protein